MEGDVLLEHYYKWRTKKYRLLGPSTGKESETTQQQEVKSIQKKFQSQQHEQKMEIYSGAELTSWTFEWDLTL